MGHLLHQVFRQWREGAAALPAAIGTLNGRSAAESIRLSIRYRIGPKGCWILRFTPGAILRHLAAAPPRRHKTVAPALEGCIVEWT
jgi:hypothetical protein